jgi:TATA-box binding protein (TBP) (component of TFIID and TFIIIB)
MDTPILSTMVVLYKTNLHIDTDKVLNELPINQQIVKVEKRGVLKRGESKRDKIKRRTKDEPVATTGFGHNSITIVVMNDGNQTLAQKEITVKVFQNGVFHLTGVLDDAYDRDTMNILLKTLWDSCRDCITSNDEPLIVERRVVLMNYTTKLTSNNTIAREALYNSLKARGIDSHYDPDVYPGVKIHIGKCTAKVFRTGKIILTGITTHEGCLEFKTVLESLFDEVLPKSQMQYTQSAQVAR